jgi:hypothetical protein
MPSRPDQVQIVLPDDEHDPASLLETVPGISVAPDVRGELRGPPIAIGLRQRAMQRTGVPIASPDVDGDPCPSEHHIEATPGAREDRLVDSIPEPETVEFPPKSHLGFGIPSRLPLHPGQRRVR